jgi:hypothetical protein
MSGFSQNSTVTTTPSAYLNFLNKDKTPFECKCQIGSSTFRFFFVNEGENLVMADDVATPSNLPVAPLEKKMLEDAPLDETSLDEASLDEAPLDINVFQWSCEEEPSIRVVHTRVDRSAWDRRLSPNPHALAIYLEFVPTREVAPERFKEC